MITQEQQQSLSTKTGVQQTLKPQISPAEFFAVDMRVGRIVSVEEFPEARRPAYKLTVDFGEAIGTKRTSAQVTNYTTEELLGRLVIGVINLGTKQVGKFMSEFLILGSIDADDRVLLLSPEPNAEPGQHVA